MLPLLGLLLIVFINCLKYVQNSWQLLTLLETDLLFKTFFWPKFKSRLNIPYSDKFWRRKNLAQLAQNGKNRQIKSVPNLIFFSLRQIW